MTTVHLVRLGAVPPDTMTAVGQAVGDILGYRVNISSEVIDPLFAFDPGRGQYNSTEILRLLEAGRLPGADKILGLTEVDLFIPILTYVFGEAYLNRSAAVISLHRLNPRFYGLPPDPALVLRRAQTEAIHELGHTLGLIHCPDYACVMHASRVADEIDLKTSRFCAECAASLSPRRLPSRLSTDRLNSPTD